MNIAVYCLHRYCLHCHAAGFVQVHSLGHHTGLPSSCCAAICSCRQPLDMFHLSSTPSWPIAAMRPYPSGKTNLEQHFPDAEVLAAAVCRLHVPMQRQWQSCRERMGKAWVRVEELRKQRQSIDCLPLHVLKYCNLHFKMYRSEGTPKWCVPNLCAASMVHRCR